MSSGSNDQTPWEDTVILAFRDMQWMRKQNANYEAFVSARRESDTVESETLRDNFLTQICTPPPLLAKLDGQAETASGDTLTAINERFFLLEFKASNDKLRDEKGKFMYMLMQSVVPTRDLDFMDLSRRGHFVVYPDFPESRPHAKQGLLSVNKVRLETLPYLDALHDEKLDPKPIEPASAEQVLWAPDRGLSINEMAAYLKALCETHSGDSSRHPIKAIIATPNGLIWPIADLSHLVQLAKYFQVGAHLDHSTELDDRLKVTVENLRVGIAQKKKNAEGESLTPGGSLKETVKKLIADSAREQENAKAEPMKKNTKAP